MRALPVRFLTAAALAVPATFGTLALTAPAPAGADSASVSVAVATPSAAALPVALPNSNIQGKAPNVKFKPSKLSATWSASKPPKGNVCTVAKEKVTIINKTAVSQTVTAPAPNPSFTLPAHTGTGLCFWGTGTRVFKLGLKGSKSHLSITVT